MATRFLPRSIRTRLVLLLAVLVLVPVLAGFALFSRVASRIIEEQLMASQNAVLQQTVLHLERITGTLSTAVNYLSSSAAGRRFLAAQSDPDQGEQFLAVQELQSTMRLISTSMFRYTMHSYFLTEDIMVATVSDTSRNRDVIQESTWYRRALSQPERMHWSIEERRLWHDDGPAETLELTVARAIRSYDRSTVAAVAAVSINARDLLSILEDGMILEEAGTASAGTRGNEDDLFMTMENGWVVRFPLAADQVLAELRTLQRHGVILVTALALLVAVVIVLNVFSTTRSLVVLREKIQEVEAGNLNTRMPPLGDDETGQLAGQFNRMLDQIQLLFQQVEHEHHLAEEARFARLRAQVRPHFLLNSLNTLNWSARMSGADNVSRMIQALSAILERSLYERESVVPLSREVETARQFLLLETLRTGDRWDLTIDDTALDGDPQCPVFCLQPLVENALEHGIAPDREEIVQVSVILRGCPAPPPGLVEIIVEDDGRGFDTIPDDGHPREGVSADGGIGLWNIHQRVRSLFGPSWGVFLERRDPGGARVSIRFPYTVVTDEYPGG